MEQHKEILEDNMNFILNEEEKAAYFCGTKLQSENLLIPRSIKYNEQEYLVTRIEQPKMCLEAKYIQFPQNSELKIIGSLAFKYSSIESFKIPSSVVKLEDGWCDETEKLIKVEVDPNNKFYKNYNDEFILGKTDENNEIFDVIVFAQRNLEKVTIPTFIKKINAYAFCRCTKLHTVEIPSNSELQIIGERAFAYSGIKSFIFLPQITHIGSYAFYHCKNLTQVEFPDNFQIQEFEDGLFNDSSLENLKIPDSITRIGNSVFKWCQNLKQVEFSKNSKLKTIGDRAFNYSTFGRICFPSSLIEIGEYAFAMNGNLLNIEFPEDSQTKIIKQKAFGWTGIHSIILPSHLTILDYFFPECQNLKSIKFQENSEVQEIKRLALSDIPIESFKIPSSVVKLEDGWCDKAVELTKVEVDPNNKFYKNYNDEFILGKTDENNEIFDVIVFAQRNLEKVTIPTFIKKINAYAFWRCTKLHTVEIPSNSELQFIGECAFYDTLIESILIPRHVTKLDNLIFSICKNLKKIYFEDNSELSVIDLNIFFDTLIEKLTIPENVVEIYDTLYVYPETPIKLDIDSNNKHIINYGDELILGKTDDNKEIFDVIVFALRKIEKLTIPSYIKKINPYAFIRTDLQFIDIPTNSELQFIGEGAFDFLNIQSIFLPSHLNQVYNDFIKDLDNLQIIEISEKSQLNLFENNNYKGIIMVPA